MICADCREPTTNDLINGRCLECAVKDWDRLIEKTRQLRADFERYKLTHGQTPKTVGR